RGARELAGAVSRENGPRLTGIPARAYLPEIFRSHERAHVETWLRGGLEREIGAHDVHPEPFRAELHSGVGVRLTFAAPAQGRAAMIRLEPLLPRESRGQAEI